MSPERLEEAMRIGGKSDYSGNSLGKYGFGLKGASWSQTKVFTVVTKEDGQAAQHMTWDAHDMGEWEVKSDPLEAWEVIRQCVPISSELPTWRPWGAISFAPATSDSSTRPETHNRHARSACP